MGILDKLFGRKKNPAQEYFESHTGQVIEIKRAMFNNIDQEIQKYLDQKPSPVDNDYIEYIIMDSANYYRGNISKFKKGKKLSEDDFNKIIANACKDLFEKYNIQFP